MADIQVKYFSGATLATQLLYIKINPDLVGVYLIQLLFLAGPLA